MEQQLSSKRIVPRRPVQIVLEIPTEDKIVTMRHALNKINQIELKLLINRYNIPIPSEIKKVNVIKYFISQLFMEGRLQPEVFDEVRTLAFNPELYGNDGFFLSYEAEINKNKESFEQTIEKWHSQVIDDDDEEVAYDDKMDAEIEVITYSPQNCSLLVTRKFERYVHDGETMYSHQYYDIHSLVVEINFEEKIIFVQTSNTVKFSSIKTVVSSFMAYLINENAAKNEYVKLSIPKMEQSLSMTIAENGWTAIANDNINSNTLKLLDLFLELENNSDNFDSFRCAHITFDHEDSSSDLDDRIKVQSFGADIGDLLKKKEVKDLILNNRNVLKVEFRLIYTTIVSEEITKKHTINAGIENGKRLRIYIYNNDLSIKETIKDAYKDLKSMFIEHLGETELRNEEKIKNMLGL